MKTHEGEVRGRELNRRKNKEAEAEEQIKEPV